MADVVAMFASIVTENLFLFLTIIFGVLSLLPWIGLVLLNVFNKNVWKEIMATFNRKAVKVFVVLQNGQSKLLYREMNPDRSITLAKNQQSGIDETLTPTTPPHPDADSHRQVYVMVEGQEGTKDMLAETKYDVNSPQKKMVYGMGFELGREYERMLATPPALFNWKNIAIVAAPTLLLLLVLFMVYSQGTVIGEIAEAVGVVMK